VAGVALRWIKDRESTGEYARRIVSNGNPISSMSGSSLARNLVLLTAVKVATLIAIYAWLFAPFEHAPIDPASHIAGPAMQAKAP
jgi:hypothetical protein